LIFSIGIRNVVNVKKIQVYIFNIRFGNGVEWGSAMGMSLLLLGHGSSMQVPLWFKFVVDIRYHFYWLWRVSDFLKKVLGYV